MSCTSLWDFPNRNGIEAPIVDNNTPLPLHRLVRGGWAGRKIRKAPRGVASLNLTPLGVLGHRIFRKLSVDGSEPHGGLPYRRAPGDDAMPHRPHASAVTTGEPHAPGTPTDNPPEEFNIVGTKVGIFRAIGL